MSESNQRYEGPWRKQNLNALSGHEEISNFREPGRLGHEAMNLTFGERNWKLDNTAYQSETGRDPFGRLPSEKTDILVSPDGDMHQEQEK